MTEDPTSEQIEREFTMWRNSEVDRTGTLPTGYEMFRAAYELAASAVNGRHDHIEDGSLYLDCIACAAATSRSYRTRMADAVIVDMLTAFYVAERDGWSTKKVARMRAALVAAAAVLVEPVRIPDRLEVDEAKLYEAIDTAQRIWNGNGRHEPIAAAITRAVLGEIGGAR